MKPKGSWKWSIGVLLVTMASSAAYLGAHNCSPELRMAGSAVLATLSGACWSLSSALPIRSLTGRWFGASAALCALFSGVCLLP